MYSFSKLCTPQPVNPQYLPSRTRQSAKHVLAERIRTTVFSQVIEGTPKPINLYNITDVGCAFQIGFRGTPIRVMAYCVQLMDSVRVLESPIATDYDISTGILEGLVPNSFYQIRVTAHYSITGHSYTNPDTLYLYTRGPPTSVRMAEYDLSVQLMTVEFTQSRMNISDHIYYTIKMYRLKDDTVAITNDNFDEQKDPLFSPPLTFIIYGKVGRETLRIPSGKYGGYLISEYGNARYSSELVFFNCT